MKRITETFVVRTLAQIPSMEVICALPRNKKMKIIFEGEINEERKLFGTYLKNKLNGFLVGIHMNNPEINICRIITDSEIEDNQLFFEKCAIDYRNLANCLMAELNKKFDDTLDNDAQETEVDLNVYSPQEVWERMQNVRGAARGYIGDWSYYMHGLHFCFENVETKQIIEVSISHGDEYGVLDPYFFSKYIKSTSQYYPLPVEIYEEFHDGDKIIDKMVELGKFELIQSYRENEFVPVVANR